MPPQHPHPRLDGVPPSRPGMGGTWGTPHPRLDGVTPQTWDGGTPRPRLDGVPPSISKASTCYAAGGVPLASTQDDFLVYRFSEKPTKLKKLWSVGWRAPGAPPLDPPLIKIALQVRGQTVLPY